MPLAPNLHRYLPPTWNPAEVTTCFGLISDTHAPQRCPELPAILFDILAGVDLLLHAGDVGELWVLDQLSAIAPVVAVHGNDDSPLARQELPYQQVITVAGQRLLLWHSHIPNRAEELAFRHASDAWPDKLARLVKRAEAVGSQLVVYGHIHIPFVRQFQGVQLINPGAIAPPNFFKAQTVQTVALLFVNHQGEMAVNHINLAQPEQIYYPQIDWTAGFTQAAAQFNHSILSQELETHLPHLMRLSLEDTGAMIRVLAPLSHQCWAGHRKVIGVDDLLSALDEADFAPPTDKAAVRAVLRG